MIAVRAGTHNGCGVMAFWNVTPCEANRSSDGVSQTVFP
jgi:hypothetical protein